MNHYHINLLSMNAADKELLISLLSSLPLEESIFLSKDITFERSNGDTISFSHSLFRRVSSKKPEYRWEVISDFNSKIGTHSNVFFNEGTLKINENYDLVISHKNPRIIKVQPFNPNKFEQQACLELEYLITKTLGHLKIKPPVVNDKFCFFTLRKIPGQTLQEVLEDHWRGLLYPGHQPALTVEIMLRLSLSLARAFKHLKDNKIEHRDIKPANIMADLNLMIPVNFIDFGLSQFSAVKDSNREGNYLYAAPEVIAQKRNKSRLPIRYHRKSEIYSIGLILEDIWRNTFPPTFKDTVNILADARSKPWEPDLFHNISNDMLSPFKKCVLKNLIKQMLEINPESRIEIETIISTLESIQPKSKPPILQSLFKIPEAKQEPNTRESGCGML